MLLQAAGKSNALRMMLKAESERGQDFLRLANALSAINPATARKNAWLMLCFWRCRSEGQVMKPKPKRSLQKTAVQRAPLAKARRRDAAAGENPNLAALKEHRSKPTGSAVSTKDRGRSSQGSQTLQELFEIGAQLFKGLDTKTIMRIAEDKDLEYT